MVTCPKCLGDLPYNCTCIETKAQKLAKYAKLVNRELNLLTAILKGYNPKITVTTTKKDSKKKEEVVEITTYDAEVYKIEDYYYSLRIGGILVSKGTKLAATLLDQNEIPLYKREFTFDNDATVFINWDIGIPRSLKGKKGEKHE
jgi:hypothetical protein